eukprot:TRINITY_DN25282_c0_g1_i1.p1 TRINITY_DN25282_c0_g1~~TRINITY_DN25282_c0_g1_i1.p1  ORF type:complete len:490 (+),score=84.20 TRINITY_DN25282_c0_g1_i1:128-1597(+)
MATTHKGSACSSPFSTTINDGVSGSANDSSGGDGSASTSDRIWAIAATAVWIEHLTVVATNCGDGLTGAEPTVFTPVALSWWAASLLSEALPVVLEELRRHGITIKRVSSDDGNGDADVYKLSYIFGGTESASRCDGGVGDFGNDGSACCGVRSLDSTEDLKCLLSDVCAPLLNMHIDWLPPLRATVSGIAEILIETLGSSLNLSQLREIKVQHATMFNEDWSVPLDVAWQADGASNTIVMPDVPSFGKPHFDYFATYSMRHPGQTLLYQFLSTYVIPCHEVLHIVQHLHGHLLDRDPRSYAMEHDASRLNYVLLWHVLQRDGQSAPEWFKWVVMLEAVNRTLHADEQFRGRFRSKRPAYRRWAASFGLDSPCAAFDELSLEGGADGSSGDDVALRLESLVKHLVAGEALGLRGSPPSRSHLDDLLRVAFDSARHGDVYSIENRQRVAAALPTDLSLTDDEACARLTSPPSAGDGLDRLVAALRRDCCG